MRKLHYKKNKLYAKEKERENIKKSRSIEIDKHQYLWIIELYQDIYQTIVTIVMSGAADAGPF